jgi:Tfp pilus assembly protein PilE
VVVIIGILAAIAVPTYNNYITKYRNKAAVTAIAEVKSRLSLEYAQYLLKKKDSPTTMTVFLNTTAGNDTTKTIKNYAIDIGDDFEVTLDPVNKKADIKVEKFKDVDLTENNSGEWKLPD